MKYTISEFRKNMREAFERASASPVTIERYGEVYILSKPPLFKGGTVVDKGGVDVVSPQPDKNKGWADSSVEPTEDWGA